MGRECPVSAKLKLMRPWLSLLMLPAAIVLLRAADEKPAPKGDVKRGEDVFFTHCVNCHDPYSKEERTGPGLQGIKEGRLPDGRPATRERLLDVINEGPAEMPGFADRLTAGQKEDLIAFVLQL
jgi:mono/diheme cytochrome c family protein